jgi:DNA modification methylase
MTTDPPYGVNYDPEWRNEAGVSATMRIGKVASDDRADWREAWALFPGDVAYVWHTGVHARTVIESLEAAGFVVRSQIIWAKSRFVLGRGDYHWQHEPALYAVRKGATGHWQGARAGAASRAPPPASFLRAACAVRRDRAGCAPASAPGRRG